MTGHEKQRTCSHGWDIVRDRARWFGEDKVEFLEALVGVWRLLSQHEARGKSLADCHKQKNDTRNTGSHVPAPRRGINEPSDGGCFA
jgi:hypothetical protein